MAGNMVNVIIQATDNASRHIDNINSALSRVGTEGGNLARTMSLASGAIAGLAPAAAGLGGLAGTFAAAGVGAAAFGAVAVSSIGNVVEASEEVAKAEEKIKQADSTRERIAAQKELASVMGGLSKAQQGALKDLQNFQSWWSGFTKQFDTPVFKVFGEGMKLIQNTMTALTPTITSVGNALGGWLEKVNASFKTDTVKGFFDYFSESAAPSLTAMLTSTGNLFKGFMEILMAFAPISTDMEGGMVKLTASFAKWASELAGSQSFQNFVNFAKTNAPILLSVIGGLWNTIVKLVQALAPLGAVVLQLADSFLQWITTSETAKTAFDALKQAGEFLKQNFEAVKVVVASLLAGFIAFKAISSVVAVVNLVTTVMGTLSKVLGVAKKAFLLLRAAMLANPIAWVIVAIVALIAIGVLLYKNWDTVTAKAKELWTKVKKVWEDIKIAVSKKITEMIQAVQKWASDMKAKMGEMWENVKQKTSEGVQKVVQFFKGLPSKAASALSDLGSKIKEKFLSAMESAKQAVTDGVQAVVTAIKDFAGTFLDAGKGLLESFTKGIGKGIEGAKTAVSKGMSAIRAFLPFSPSKKGALRDLDKSGESFFPTWYKGALTKVKAMKREIGGAMHSVNNALQSEAGSVGLESFTGGRSKFTVIHAHEHTGAVQIKGDNGSKETLKLAGKTVRETTESDIMRDLRQTIRRR
ncbi:hypothetical protein AB1K32_13310 [Metabacillus dongyingensis]|uniref:hypothetical protein n=1 Tax=Metabacillus dongyingensis TaxID=2874282 RepID=UPI003B8BC406